MEGFTSLSKWHRTLWIQAAYILKLGWCGKCYLECSRKALCKFKTKIKTSNENCPRLVDTRNNQGIIELRITKCTDLVFPKILRIH